MSIPPRVWTVIYYPWSELLLPGLLPPDPLPDDNLNDPAPKEIGEYAGERKDPPKNCFWHLNGLPSAPSPDTPPSLPRASE